MNLDADCITTESITIPKGFFNELAASNFDTGRIEGWWDQTAFASTRDNVWFKTALLPAIGRYGLKIAYVLIAFKTNEFLITTTLFIVLFELYEAWWYRYKVSQYLKEYDDIPEKTDIKKKIAVELGISLFFYPIYFLNQEWLLPLVLIIAAYFQVFHYVFNYYYLPKLIGELNRKKAQHNANNV